MLRQAIGMSELVISMSYVDLICGSVFNDPRMSPGCFLGKCFERLVICTYVFRRSKICFFGNLEERRVP